MRCKVNRRTLRGVPGFYSISDYTAVILSAHLVAVKCEVFTTTSTREVQLCARPATHLTRSPYFRQTAYASPLRMHDYCLLSVIEVCTFSL